MSSSNSKQHHCHPIDDEKPHDLTLVCACEPRIEIINGHYLVVHNAYDRRVAIEVVNDILGNPNPLVNRWKRTTV